jgi:thiamine-phosphate pyrophosphorylase
MPTRRHPISVSSNESQIVSAQRRPRLYLITDRESAKGRDLVEVVANALAPLPRGAAAVQLRERDLCTRDLVILALSLRAVTRTRGCALLINDRLDVAMAASADGVHLPESGLDIATARALLGPAGLIGVSTHSPEAAISAARQGADIIVCGPVWPTPSKASYGPALGPGALATAAAGLRGTRAALYALGGVTSVARARAARLAGAHGVAGIRAFVAATDPGHAAESFFRAVTNAH